MADQAVIVTAPARLHLGLVKLTDAPTFAAAGLSLCKPSLKLRMSLTDEEQPPSAALEAANAILRHVGGDIRVKVETLETLPAHHGFGSGTRVALAAALGALALAGKEMEIMEAARVTGRGTRSAMGITLFREGGLAWDVEGKIKRAPAPDDCRVILIYPKVAEGEGAGLSGGVEETAIRAVSRLTEHDYMLLRLDLAGLYRLAIPGPGDDDSERFDTFAMAVETLQRLATEQFGPAQGGAASTTAGRAILKRLREEMGVKACGQSSWGPVLFAITQTPEEAQNLAETLSAMPETVNTVVTPITNHGYTVEWEP